MWPSILHDRTLYEGLVGEIANPVAVLDGPGHGHSGLNLEGLDGSSLARSAELVAQAAFGAQPFVMVGTSWGALVAAELAARPGNGLLGAVLFNAPWTAHPHASIGDRMIALMARFLPQSTMFRRGVARSFFAPETHSEQPELIAAFLSQDTFANPGLAVAVRSVLVDRHRVPAPDPADLTIPIAVASGALDQLYSVDVAQDRANRMPRATHHVVPGTAHITAAEDPVSAAGIVNGLLKRIEQCGEDAA